MGPGDPCGEGGPRPRLRKGRGPGRGAAPLPGPGRRAAAAPGTAAGQRPGHGSAIRWLLKKQEDEGQHRGSGPDRETEAGGEPGWPSRPS